MYSVGDKIIYGENGVCTIDIIAPLPMAGSSQEKLYYHLTPYIGSGTYYAPVGGNTFMRPVMDREAALAFIDTIPQIEPAICSDTRFNHVDAFYKELFKLHTNEALVAAIKGLTERMSGKKTRSSRSEATMKRAKDILYGEISVAVGIPVSEVESFIASRTSN